MEVSYVFKGVPFWYYDIYDRSIYIMFTNHYKFVTVTVNLLHRKAFSVVFR